LLTLPKPLIEKGPRTPRRLGEAVAPAVDVPASVEDVRGLRLTLVESEIQMRTWNELMLREHPRGAGPLVGRQLYYLVESEHGILGALGYGAAALKLAARDAWIGWSAEIRADHLQRIVGLGRFLIRNDVGCRNADRQPARNATNAWRKSPSAIRTSNCVRRKITSASRR